MLNWKQLMKRLTFLMKRKINYGKCYEVPIILFEMLIENKQGLSVK